MLPCTELYRVLNISLVTVFIRSILGFFVVSTEIGNYIEPTCESRESFDIFVSHIIQLYSK